MKKRAKGLPPQALMLGLFLIFALPFGLVAHSLVTEIKIRVDLTTQERQGIRYIKTLRDLLESLIQQQALIQNYWQGNQTEKQAILDHIKVVDAAVQTMSDLERELGKTLNTTNRWKSFKAHWQQFKDGLLARSPETTQVMHNNLMTELLGLFAQVGDTSNLVLDSNLDSYYLMDTVVNQIPRMINNSVAIRGLVIQLADPQQRGRNREEWLGLQSSIQSTLNQVNRSIQITLAYNHKLPSSLRALNLDVSFNNNAFLELINRFMQRGAIEDYQSFVRLSNRALTSQFKLYDATIPALDHLLELRINQLRSRQQRVQLFELVVLLTLLGILIVFVHTLKRQQQSDAAVEAAEAANRAKSMFLSNMSHELRTPLNIILGFTQLLIRGSSLNPKQEEQLAAINRSGEHLLTLINDVLEMSKIEAGRVTLNETDFNFYELLDWVYQMFQFKCQSKGLQLIVERSENLPKFIRTDINKLRQVLVNLLGNATKFTHEGGIALRVQVKPDENDDQVSESRQDPANCILWFEVEDTGPGIAPADLERLFQPFVQTATGHQSQEGTGLGLAISQKFVTLMGGEITVSSTQGYGSLFRFTICAQIAEAVPQKTSTNQQIIGLAPEQPQYRILVVDDKPENRQILVDLLTPVGFLVQQADNGKDAIAQWEAWSPDLICMDVRMPLMDGYEATRQIKAACAKRGQKSPVIIALTGSVFEQDRKVALEAGCNDFMRKPFRTEEIFEKLIEHLGVCYVYAKPEDLSGKTDLAKSHSPQTALVLTSTDLTVMPSEWIQALHQSALKVNAKLVLNLVEQIPPNHTHLANSLQRLVDNFCFEEIVELCEKAFSTTENIPRHWSFN